MPEKKPTKEELLRYAMKAIDLGDTELAKKFIDQAERITENIDDNKLHVKRSRSCRYCNASMPINANFCKKCGRSQ